MLHGRSAEPARERESAARETQHMAAGAAVAPEVTIAPEISAPPFPPPPSLEPQVALPPEFAIGDTRAKPFAFPTLLSHCRHVDWKPDRTHLLFCDGCSPHEVGSEEFRTLRSRLYQLRQQRQLNTLLVTSAMAGDGKSFVAANLAQVIVRMRGRRVLLIDADLRWSRLHFSLGAPLSPGLTDYLRGEADEYAILQRSTLENLLFIPGGKPASNPAELINNGRLRILLQRLGEEFDWVIIDSPPAIMLSDASIIAGMCDGVLLVVRSAVTSVEWARRACREFRPNAVLGVVLNGVERKASYGSYYYYSYGYGPDARKKKRSKGK